LRSDLLVHWTGAKDISPGVRELADLDRLTPDQESAYVQRLRDILIGGLKMTTPREKIRGPTTAQLVYEAPMVCFTEVRLSETFNHAARYGLLGIAVDRRFVLDSFGAPVHYLRNHAQERLLARATDLGAWIRDSKPKDDYRNAYYYMISFLKPMSNPDTDDFTYLDEHEWRIVAPHDYGPSKSIRTRQPGSVDLYVELKPEDIRLLTFPNDATRQKASNDKTIMDWFRAIGRPPVFLTVRECLQF
jgi:hypothetical protein